jgi:hypothetical protein
MSILIVDGFYSDALALRRAALVTFWLGWRVFFD